MGARSESPWVSHAFIDCHMQCIGMPGRRREGAMRIGVPLLAQCSGTRRAASGAPTRWTMAWWWAPFWSRGCPRSLQRSRRWPWRLPWPRRTWQRGDSTLPRACDSLWHMELPTGAMPSVTSTSLVPHDAANCERQRWRYAIVPQCQARDDQAFKRCVGAFHNDIELARVEVN